jgi:hypothetical protein
MILAVYYMLFIDIFLFYFFLFGYFWDTDLYGYYGMFFAFVKATLGGISK